MLGDTVTASESDARAMLLQIAGRRPLPVPAAIVVDLVLGLPGNWDWPVRRAALEAVLRRLASARAQEISVVDAPRRSAWGRYRLGRAGAAAADRGLPYEVRLWSASPIRGSCDCADFLRAALGLCKHLAAVMFHLAHKPRAFQRMVAAPPAPPLGIFWEAAEPAAYHSGDALEAIRFAPPGANGKRVPVAITNLFRRAPEGAWCLRATHASDPEKRLHLIVALQRLVRAARAAADPAAQMLLAEERSSVERLRRLRVAGPALAAAIRASKRRRLYPYQKDGVWRFLTRGRLVLADDMGLGKTTQAVVAASALYEAGLVRRGLFVVPATLKAQWEREWRAISPVPLRVVEGGASERQAIYAGTGKGFLVTNYEQVVKDVEAIAAWSPQLAVLDEAQRIKNWATKTALTIKQLRPEYRLVLTGTPLENRLEELASIVEWVDDRVLEPKWRLVPWHSAYADGHQEVVGARNLDALRARLAPVLLRRTRSEVLPQLPARQDTIIPVDLTDRQRDAHDGLNQAIARLASIAGRRPLQPPEFLRLMSLLATQRMIANGLALEGFVAIWPTIRDRPATAAVLESLDAPKLAELRELISNLVLGQGRKVVVFSQWRRMLELGAWAVADLLVGVGKRALFFTGQEGARRRTHNLVDFHDDPNAAVLFLTDAGGVGLNLQKAATVCINLELPWNPAVLEQRIGRIHRLGQDRPIDVYNLMSRACIEERIATLVADKRALFKGLFEGTTDELRFDAGRGISSILEHLAAPTDPTVAVVTVGEQEGPSDDEPADPDAPNAAADDLASLDDESSPVFTAPAVSDSTVPPSPTLATEAPHDDVARLFGAVRVERRADGAVVIEAPPEAARALVSLFEGLTRLMATAAAPAASVPPSVHGTTPVGAQPPPHHV